MWLCRLVDACFRDVVSVGSGDLSIRPFLRLWGEGATVQVERGQWSVRLTTAPVRSVKAEAFVNNVSGRLRGDKMEKDVLQVVGVRSEPLCGFTPLYGGDVGPVAQEGGILGVGADEIKVGEGAVRGDDGDGAAASIVEGAVSAPGGILVGSEWMSS